MYPLQGAEDAFEFLARKWPHLLISASESPVRQASLLLPLLFFWPDGDLLLGMEIKWWLLLPLLAAEGTRAPLGKHVAALLRSASPLRQILLVVKSMP